MIPEEKSGLVSRALLEAFGTDVLDDVSPQTAGLSSALIFRIVVKGRPYLLRLITRTDALGDPTNQIACMKSAAEAGLAPQIRYSSVEDRMLITDFITSRPFPQSTALARFPETLRKLHARPPFPRTIDYLERMDGAVRRFLSSTTLPPGEVAELTEVYEALVKAYPKNETEWVSSHNDLKPENVIFDGEQIWLVDWEAAFLNDRYLDLAVVANFVVKDEVDEEQFLTQYFGEAPGERRRAQFFLMRQLLHMFYGALMILFSPTAQALRKEETVAEFDEYHDAIWSGEVSLAGHDKRVEYARVHLNRLLQNTGTERFREAVGLKL